MVPPTPTNRNDVLHFGASIIQNMSADPDRFRHGLHRESPFGGNGGERIGGRNAFIQLLDCEPALRATLIFNV